MPDTIRPRIWVVVCLLLALAAVANAQTVDPAFNPGADEIAWSMAVQPDGKVVVGGGFTHLGGGTGTTIRAHIGRLNTDGTVDLSFNPGANGIVQAIALQPDGKILVGGTFSTVGGGTGPATVRSRIARLNADGSVDMSFDPGASNTVYAIVVQPDGKILVGGEFATMGGGGAGPSFATTRNRIARLDPDGSVDPSFNPGASKISGSAIVYTMALQPDGRIVVGGYFNGLGGGTGSTARNYIGRINADGTLDATFNPGATFYVNALVLQPDGRIVAAGDFHGLGGGDGSLVSRLYLGRLFADGTVDGGFNPGAESEVHTLGLQADGRIVAAGYFKWLGGAGDPTIRSARNYIGRINPNGTVDPSFNQGADNVVESVAIQADGGILASGHFLNAGGATGLATARKNIVRFLTTDPAVQTLTVTGGGSVATTMSWMRSGGGPEVTRATFEWSLDGNSYALFYNGVVGADLRVPGGWQVTGANLPSTRKIWVRARGYYGSGYQTGSGSIVESVITANSPSDPHLSLDGPANNSSIKQPFNTGGWAVDLGSPTGTGVDAIHVWAFPVVNGAIGAGQFVSAAILGGARADVAAAFGSQFANAGFNFLMTGLAPGQYYVGVYVHSSVTGTFAAQQFALVTILPSGPVSDPRMSLDGPANNSTIQQPFNTGGWAVDRGAASGTGVDAIHVWAFPVVNGVIGAGQFVSAAILGGARADVGTAFGSQFTNAGFNFLMTGLTPGQYYVGVYVHSTVTGSFNQQQFALVTIVP